MSTSSGVKFPSNAEDVKFQMKVVMNKQKTKVLFAEAGSDVVDVLLSFLTLPLGKIVRILEKHCGGKPPAIGSLTILSRGLLNLDSSHFCAVGAKKMLLNPSSSFEDEWCRLNLGFTTEDRTRYFCCPYLNCDEPCGSNISMYSDIAKCDCGRPLNRAVVTELKATAGDAGVFIVKESSFIISDNLRVVPIVSGFIQTLNNLGITDTYGAEITTFTFGIHDIMDLVKFSLISATPLTDLIIKKTHMCSTVAKSGPGILLHHIHKDVTKKMVLNALWPKKMMLKVFLQKSTNAFLLAEGTDEFVEFLFSFLAIPLGGVEFVFAGKTCLQSIDNLYRSVSDAIDHMYFTTSGAKNRLMNPKLAHGYVSKKQFLPLSEESPPKINLNYDTLVSSFKPGKGQRNFIREGTMYIVSDDLTVAPFSITSSISIPNAMGISLSDVKRYIGFYQKWICRLDLQIGMEEALCVLKASLTSTTVLTDALINPMLHKLLKEDDKKLPNQDESKLQKLPMQNENELPKQDENKLPKQDDDDEARSIGSFQTYFDAVV